MARASARHAEGHRFKSCLAHSRTRSIRCGFFYAHSDRPRPVAQWPKTRRKCAEKTSHFRIREHNTPAERNLNLILSDHLAILFTDRLPLSPFRRTVPTCDGISPFPVAFLCLLHPISISRCHIKLVILTILHIIKLNGSTIIPLPRDATMEKD